jgi:hypothetical protein
LELEGSVFEYFQFEFGKFRQSFFSNRLLHEFAYEIETLMNPGKKATKSAFWNLQLPNTGEKAKLSRVRT